MIALYATGIAVAALLALYIVLRWDISRRARNLRKVANTALQAQHAVRRTAVMAAEPGKSMRAYKRRKALRKKLGLKGNTDVGALGAVVGLAFFCACLACAIREDLPMASIWFGLGLMIEAVSWKN